MRSGTALLILALLTTSCRSAPVSGGPLLEVRVTDPFGVVTEADRLAAQDLWPGFDPRATPVAIYDGERTLLFRHPAPPEGFQPVPGREGVWVYTGRHPSVTANSSAEIAGVRAATLMPSAEGVPFAERAGILLHELFHVFQRERHPAWSANEAELFSYPVDAPDLLALRRMETETLRRALSSSDPDRTRCWARIALDLRRERFAALPSGSAGYERGTELHEGLASYVQRRATGSPDSTVLPVGGFAPEAIRQRGYESGVAIARLLDRLSPAWRTQLEQNDSIPLDVLLSASLAPGAEDVRECALAPAERESIRATAGADIRALRDRRAEQRRRFLEQPGWRVLVTGAPLFPQGFDPLNVQAVAPGEVLHTRFLKLGHRTGSVEVIGRAALTEAAGAHPLFNGVRTLTVAGLASEPRVVEANGVVTMTADGVTAEFRGAAIQRTGQLVTIRLPAER